MAVVAAKVAFRDAVCFCVRTWNIQVAGQFSIKEKDIPGSKLAIGFAYVENRIYWEWRRTNTTSAANGYSSPQNQLPLLRLYPGGDVPYAAKRNASGETAYLY